VDGQGCDFRLASEKVSTEVVLAEMAAIWMILEQD
jgi:hypothetical protein